MTQAEFNKLVNADIKAQVDAAAAQYAARIADIKAQVDAQYAARIANKDYFEADLTPAQQSYADAITNI